MQVYLDNSATTRPSGAVREAVAQFMEEDWYNPSALYRPALQVQKKIEEVRSLCLKAVSAKNHDVIFTASGTEADNLAILGYLKTLRGQGRILVSSIEHPAVNACRIPAEKLGFKMEEIPVTAGGIVDLNALEKMLSDDVKQIAVMQVNNETGAVQPLEDIVRMRDRFCPGTPIHVDGVQGFLRIPVRLNTLNIQSYALSGHKIHALKGIGALIVQKQHRLQPIIFGGGQEKGLRSGTENTYGILSLGTAIEHYPANAAEHMRKLKSFLWEAVHERIPSAVVNGPEVYEGSPHILNLSLEPVRSQTMLFALEGDGVYVSAGSACSSHKQKVSPVLTSMGIAPARADCALRFSFNPFQTEEEMLYTADSLERQYSILSKYVRK